MIKRIFYTCLFLVSVSPVARAQDDIVVPEDEYYDSVTSDTNEESRFSKPDRATLQIPARKADPALVQELRNDEELSYVRNSAKEKANERKRNTSTDSWLDKLARMSWFKNLMWIIIIIAFLAILVAFLTRSNVNIFRKKEYEENSDQDEGDLTKNIFDINYDAEIPAAIAGGKYHLAIRLLYLQTLKGLSNQGLIEYRQEKTNGDYVFQLFNTPYYKQFFTLTRNYEYVWYGQFPVSAAAFDTMHKDFVDFKRRFSS